MGFFGSGDKTNETINEQIGASDDGLIVSGGGSAAQDDATVISNGYQGTTILQGAGGLNNSSVGGSINFGVTASEVANLLSGALGTVTEGLAGVVDQQTDAANDQINSTLSSLEGLAMSKQTDGQSSRDNTILYVIVAGLAFLAFFFWKK